MILFFKSFIFACQGLWFCLRHERNFRIHLVAAAYVLAFAPSFSLSATEWAILIITLALVMSAEAINTAVEHAVDLSSPNIDPTARIAKDTAAAAVLICTIASVVVGIILFYRPQALMALWTGIWDKPWKLLLIVFSLFISLLFIIKGGPEKNISVKYQDGESGKKTSE